MSRPNTPVLLSAQLIWENDEELQVLLSPKTIGDALGGTEKRPGVGMERQPFGREFLGGRDNVCLAIKCVEQAGERPEVITGHGSTVAFEAWLRGLRSNQQVCAELLSVAMRSKRSAETNGPATCAEQSERQPSNAEDGKSALCEQQRRRQSEEARAALANDEAKMATLPQVEEGASDLVDAEA
jgi:hypothetical protein